MSGPSTTTPAGADLRRKIGRRGAPIWFKPAGLSSLPQPWAALLAGWLEAFGLGEDALWIKPCR